jgi:hypothetical protein
MWYFSSNKEAAMIRLSLTVLFLTLMLGQQPAAAFSTEKGNSVPGDYVGLTDPDEQVPAFLKQPQEQFTPTNTGNFAPQSDASVIYPEDSAKEYFGNSTRPEGQSSAQK